MFRLGSRRGIRFGSALGIGAILAFGLGSNALSGHAATTQTTATTLTSSMNPAASGRNVTLTATVTPSGTTPVTPIGSVQFQDTTAAVSLGSSVVVPASGKTATASVTTSFAKEETHNIVATFTDTQVTPVSSGSASAALPEVVTVGPAALDVVSLQAPAMIANGTSTQIATATITDAAGNPRIGDTVNFSSTLAGADLTFSNPATGDSFGRYTVLVTSGTNIDVEHVIATDSTPDNQANFFAGAPGTAGWVSDTSTPAVVGDTDQQSILLTSPNTPGGGYGGVNLLGVPTTAPAAPPSYWYKSNLTTGSGGSPRLVIEFSDGGNMELGPGNLTAGPWTFMDGTTSTWVNDGGTCGFLYNTTYATALACHSTATVADAFIVNDSGWIIPSGSLNVNIDDISYGTGNLALVTKQGGGTLVSAPVNLTETNGPATLVTVTPSPTTMPTDGVSTKNFTAHVVDGLGHNVIGDTVVFSASGGITFPVPSVVTDVNGNAVGVAKAGTVVGPSPEIVSAMDTTQTPPVTGTASVTDVSGPANKIVVTATPNTLPDDGTSTSTATATVEDVNGNPVLHAGDNLLFVSTNGATFTPTTQMTNSNGVAVDTLTASAIAGTDTISVTDTTIPTVTAGHATVTQTLRNSTTALTAAPNPSVPGQAVLLTATVLPAGATGTVSFLDNGTALPTSVSNPNPAPVVSGSAVYTTSALTGNTNSLTAVYSGDPTFATSTSPAVNQVVGPLDSVVVLLHSHAMRANGTANTTATATVATLATPHVAVPDGTVMTWSSSGGVTFNATGVAPGTATATSLTTGGVATIFVIAGKTATDGGPKVTVTATAPDGSTGFDGPGSSGGGEKLLASAIHAVTFTPSSVAEGAQSSAVANVVDGNGNPVSGETVSFANDGSAGSPTFATASAISDANGNATDAVTAGNTTGSKTVTATDTTISGASDATADTLTQNASLTQIVAGATNTTFVNAAYLTMLGHLPDSAGLNYWVAQLNAGLPRSSFATVLATTSEYRNNVISGSGVNDFYQLYLHRAGDAAGVQYWVNRMAGIGGSQLTFEQVRLQFVGSPEFFSSPAVGNNDKGTAIEALYHDLLNRASDPAGKAYWLANFDASKISAQFLFSSEGRSFLVDTLYHQILNRTAVGDPGLAYWTNALLNGASDENIIASILGSNEYFSSHTS